MSDRDELFGLICGRTTLKAIERILAAGYRKPQQVTTVEELDALPVSAKLYSPRTGDVWWKRDGSHGGPWWEGSGGMYSRTSDFLDRQGETSVLWKPQP